MAARNQNAAAMGYLNRTQLMPSLHHALEDVVSKIQAARDENPHLLEDELLGSSCPLRMLAGELRAQRASTEPVDVAVEYVARRTPSLCKAVRALVRAWRGHSDDAFTVRQISGGITNMLLLVEAPGGPKSVLMRVYGKNTEILIDRALDNRIFARLAEVGFGPLFYGCFANGRLEGYLDGRPFEPHEMADPQYAPLIAKQMTRMHRLKLPFLSDESQLWSLLDKWSEMALEMKFEDDEAKAARIAALDLPSIVERIAYLRRSILPSDSNGNGAQLSSGGLADRAEEVAKALLFEPVFSHNDALAGNMLLLQGAHGPVVQLIDFEYGATNFRGFDIGNHFNEYAGFDMDLRRWYPWTAEQQRVFLEPYVRALAEGHGREDVTELVRELDGVQGAGPGGAPQMRWPQFCKALTVWIDRFALSSHIFWGLWAVIQARYSLVDFDYVEYAELRFAALNIQWEHALGSQRV